LVWFPWRVNTWARGAIDLEVESLQNRCCVAHLGEWGPCSTWANGLSRRSSDQKVGGSSPSGRATETLAALGPCSFRVFSGVLLPWRSWSRSWSKPIIAPHAEVPRGIVRSAWLRIRRLGVRVPPGVPRKPCAPRGSPVLVCNRCRVHWRFLGSFLVERHRLAEASQIGHLRTPVLRIRRLRVRPPGACRCGCNERYKMSAAEIEPHSDCLIAEMQAKQAAQATAGGEDA
jgi:hypothetical protein